MDAGNPNIEQMLSKADLLAVPSQENEMENSFSTVNASFTIANLEAETDTTPSSPSTRPATEPEAKCHLLDLPAEMRNEIFLLAMHDSRTIKIRPSGYDRPGLLLTCKAIRQEALAVFYYNSKFRISVKQYDPAPFITLTRSLRRLKLHPKKMSLTCEFTDDTPNWSNLKLYLKYIWEGGRRMFAYSPEHVWKKTGNFPSVLSMLGIGDKMVISSMVVMCKGLRDREKVWLVVERILDEQRPLLVCFDKRWGEDKQSTGDEVKAE
ncbi:Hypothetical predicted protein [Lecanosticta acicola]|uniref:F-box domain-containing protein n=1 Tax=Lecanosticta acicola TaxID=111012 RepID=A0AAI8YZY1_9PEZI|nr:Hypothetical predicted protein [Lecanosticta acicola]